MKQFFETLSQYLKALHDKRLDKDAEEWKYLHFND